MKIIHKINPYLAGLFLLLCVSFASTVHAADDSLVSATTESIHFRASYKSKVVPLPLNRIHSWVLHIETLDSKPVEKAEIAVYGGMPAHKHGLPTEPQVSEIGDGDYLVEGIKFSMIGSWQLWFDIRADGITDQVIFDIDL